MKTFGCSLVVALVVWLGASVMAEKKAVAPASLEHLYQMAARFAPTPIRVDISRLSSADRQALVKLLQAARIQNEIYMKQLWSGNPPLLAQLERDASPLGRARLHYFWINKGPWSDIDDYRAFLPGVPPRRLPGANFYPADMSREDFEGWIAKLPAEDQEQAKGFFTVLLWQDRKARSLATVKYSEEYKDELTRAAGLLRQAAELTENASLKKFLSSRAEAFLSNDYYESDLEWMDLDAPLDVTIGPYETYTDQIFGYKAAFAAYVNLRDDAETNKLSAFIERLQDIENNLPVDPKYRNPQLGAAAPIRVVDEILCAGDAAHGVQTAAYNLPNDERIVQQQGSKRVILKNIQQAKFHSVLVPIAMRTLSKNSMVDVNFDSFFTHVLAHELMHGLGPHQITVGDRNTTPRAELKDLYNALEEAKADVTGLFALQYMMDHSSQMKLGSLLPPDDAAQRQLYTTYLASAFRSLRFGLNDAHGKGMALQFNYLLDRGAFVPHGDGTFSVAMGKIKDAVRDLDHQLLTLEAEGDYAGAQQMLDQLGVVRPALKPVLDKLEGIPTDIEPIFVTAEELAPSTPTLPPRPKKSSPARAGTR